MIGSGYVQSVVRRFAALLDATAAGNGADKVGFLYTTAYAGNTVGAWLKGLALSAGAGFIGYVHSLAGAVKRTVQDKLADTVSVQDFGAVGDGVTDDTAAIQACITAAAGRIVILADKTYLITAGIECNSQTASGAYRPGAKIRGEGIGKSVILNRSGGPALKFTLTQTQGDNSYFARGTHLRGFDIITDGSSPANSRGIALQGQYFPLIEEVRLQGLLGDAIEALTDGRWANPDRYSNGNITVQRCIISGNSGWGIESVAFSNAWEIRNTYTTANTQGGYYLAGTGHIIDGGSVAGNGATANVNSGGIVLGRTAAGSSQISSIRGVEIDTNYNRQVWVQSQLVKIERCRILDDATSGAFLSPNQIEIGGITGDTFDKNTVESCYFRQSNMGAANITLVRVRLPVTDGSQTARNNKLVDPLISTAGATSGVVTPFSVENPTSAYALGNLYRDAGHLLYSSSALQSTERASAVAYLGVAQAIPVTPTAAATITANTIAFDTHGAYDNAGYAFTVPYAGMLDVQMQLGVFSGAANVGITFSVQRDNGGGYATYTTLTCRDGNAQSWDGMMTLLVAKGDKVRVQAQQAAGGTAQIGSGLGSFVSYAMR